MEKEPWPYEDIVGRTHPVFRHHTPMPAEARAAQFLSFDTLAGYKDSLVEVGRPTSRRVDLGDDEKTALAELLCLLEDMREERPQVTVTYFLPDSHKEGGAYIVVNGVFKMFDSAGHCMLLSSGRSIPLDDIWSIQSEQIHIERPAANHRPPPGL